MDVDTQRLLEAVLTRAPFSPYEGADDLNADVATQLDDERRISAP